MKTRFLFIILLIIFAASCNAAQVQLDLSKYFNNDGISAKNAQNKGSLDKGGYTFPAEGFPKDKKLIVDKVTFRLPDPMAQVNNIACQMQIIPFPKGKFTKIHVLAAGVNGNYINELFARHADGTYYNIDIAISDWCIPAKYNETIGIAFAARHGGNNENPLKCYLWKQTVNLKQGGAPVVSIKLPNNPNLHIFAITLE
jgi:hypothetical protein